MHINLQQNNVYVPKVKTGTSRTTILSSKIKWQITKITNRIFYRVIALISSDIVPSLDIEGRELASVRRYPNEGQYLEIITLGLWLSPAVSTRDPIIKLESVSSRADNGRGLILRAMTKVPCYNLFITYSKKKFRIIVIKIQN